MPPPVQWDRAGSPLPAGLEGRGSWSKGVLVTAWKQSRVSNSLVCVLLCQTSSLYSSLQLLVAAGRHTAAANPTAFFNILGEGPVLTAGRHLNTGSSEHRNLEGAMLAWPTSSTSTETEVHTVLLRHPGRPIHLPWPEEMTHLVNEFCTGLVTMQFC